ncbi:MAG: RidA family protein [SAR324 cluster bacterium]|nr:RidA family protein [SAR324 cluster bacterium]MBF0353234.1 RidA family protein [SAR324 cluster bacterium]
MSERTPVFTSTAPTPVGPYSQAIRTGNLLFVSGQIAIDPATGKLVLESFDAQCRQVLENLKAVVTAGNSTMGKVLKVTVFMKDLRQFEMFNQIYAEYFNEAKPARSCVEVSALPKGVDIEIEAITLID